MKRLGKDFLAISLLLIICKYALKIDAQDYALIRYFFPKRVIHIALAIILNYFYLKIVFDCMRDDIEMETFIIIRLGRKELLKRLLKSIGLYTVSFLAVSLILDDLLYQKVYVPGLVFMLILELAAGAMLALGYRRLKSYTFMSVLVVAVIVRWVMSAIYLSLR